MMLTLRFFAWVAISCSPLFGAAMAAPTERTPPTPFVDHGACPFECCTYRNWTANQAVVLFDKPNGRKVGKLTPGSPVLGVTGEVISTPIRLRAIRSYEEGGIRNGGIFYALHYSGEGYWAVWYGGKVRHIQFFGDEIPSKDPHASEISKDTSVWWVKLKLPNGRIVWAISNGNFDNQDACG